MTKAKKAPKAKTCFAVVKWYAEEGKPFGFLRREDGVDLFIHRERVEEARNAGVITDTIRGGDRLEVTFEEVERGPAVVSILSYEPVPEERGFVLRYTKEGNHAILKVDGREEQIICFNDYAQRIGLALGDEVMAVITENNRGLKASSVRKTGKKVEFQPRTPKQQKLRKGGSEAKLPQALLTGVYGYVKSFNPEKGYGFITLEVAARTDTIGPDVFVSYKAVERANNLPDNQLRDGDILQFDVFPGRDAGKYEAQNLRLVEKKEWATNYAKPAAKSTKVPVYEALTGIVDWKDPDGTYGFIRLDEPIPGIKPDMFLHAKDVQASGLTVVDIIDARVTFDVVSGRKPGELQATNLRDVVIPAAIGDLFDGVAAIAAQ